MEDQLTDELQDCSWHTVSAVQKVHNKTSSTQSPHRPEIFLGPAFSHVDQALDNQALRLRLAYTMQRRPPTRSRCVAEEWLDTRGGLVLDRVID